MLEDRELVTRACGGDRAACDRLWERHRRWVAAILLAHRPRAADIEDLMQDVAVRFLGRIDTLRDPEAFRPWLRQIILNVCRGTARSLRPTLHLEAGEPDGAARVPTPAATGQSGDDQVATNEAAARLLRQALSLPREYREPLLLRCVQSLSYQQIAEILEVPVTTVETRLARARRMLREEVGAAVWDDAAGA